MTAAFLDKEPQLLDKWSNSSPVGRIGRLDELRGVIAWLASDASSFCTGSEYVNSRVSTIWILNLDPSIPVDGGHHAWWQDSTYSKEVGWIGFADSPLGKTL